MCSGDFRCVSGRQRNGFTGGSDGTVDFRCVVSQAITAVADLGVADALVNGPLPIGALATKVGARPDALHRILWALISKGIFALRADGRYELTPLAELLRSDGEASLTAAARLVGSRNHREHWSLLTEAIRTGSSVIPPLRGTIFSITCATFRNSAGFSTTR